MADQKEVSEKKNSDAGARWWEFYAVRYAMGTIAGAVTLYFVLSLIPSLRPLVFGAAAAGATALIPLKELSSVQIAVLGVAGLVYCYIASAPILVLHASRFLLAGTVVLSRWWVWGLVVAIPLSTAVLFFVEAEPKGLLALGASLLVFMVIAIVGLQYAAITLALANRRPLFAYYQQLAASRAKAEGGITDSYRHLREHGNSFFIVLLEALLGILLFAVGLFTDEGSAEVRPTVFLLVFVAWILPAVLVWAVATLFELEFSRSTVAPLSAGIAAGPAGSTTSAPAVSAGSGMSTNVAVPSTQSNAGGHP